MSLGYAHVEGAVRHCCHHYVERASCRHGWRNTHYLGVLLCQFEQGIAKHILIFWWEVVT